MGAKIPTPLRNFQFMFGGGAVIGAILSAAAGHWDGVIWALLVASISFGRYIKHGD